MDDWVVLTNGSSSDEEIVIPSSTEMEEEEEEEGEEEFPSEDNEYSSDYEIEFFDDTEADRAALINKTLPLVLARLPAKSLLRFKSVSPKFKNFISSPFIVLSHSIHPKRVSGLFYHWHNGLPCYVSFNQGPNGSDLPDPGLRFMPENVTIKASTRGILCLRGCESYYVANPVTKEWVQLPKPSAHHGDDVAVVILFDQPSVYNFGGDYQVVCAYPVIKGVYAFETFSSKAWKWARSSVICPVENIVAASGVAVGAAAYWRTTIQTILEYKPAPPKDNSEAAQNCEINGSDMMGDTSRILYHGIDPDFQYELGEMEGNLSITSKTHYGGIEVRVMEEINGDQVRWRKKGGFWVSQWDNEGRSAILRSQGKAELVTWEVLEEKKDLVLRDVTGLELRKIDGPGHCADFLPFIGTLVPVKRLRFSEAPTEQASSCGDVLGLRE